MPFTIAVIVGSLRAGSFNRQLAEALIRLPAASGHEFTFADIGSLPLYNQDDDADQPQAAKALKSLVSASDGVLFLTPEYNRSMPGVLKNALDHGSRPYGESCWAGKPAGVMGTSLGKPGTAMAQQHLRNVLAYLDMPALCQPEVFVQWSDDLLTADGTVGEGSHDFLNGWMEAFLNLVEAHPAAK
ncbi:NADPH-dependent FMN reductase [Novosphingobium beihaiensis]|uniref:NAD(P)H-dependent oxidoreductase n=1 Tax=Novosphingobium beihaiensis TaxID=2930389 RepID=A0ABT0BV52_9SPHN|nr:NADPH-dependent FMN reductase [Novosphingobium beihaiensis]MCJ2188912.1 NAD(P)H-dependent oxidoreductase [Novosphingobium beihaiensis]